MWVLRVTYLVGHPEHFGPFDCSSEAVMYGERLKRMPNSMVVGYEQQQLNSPIPYRQVCHNTLRFK